MSVYRYKNVSPVDIDQVRKRVPGTLVLGALGPDIFVDITADAGSKDDLDQVLALLGYAYDSTDPGITPTAQFAAGAITFTVVNAALALADAAIVVNGQKITGLADPSGAQDAATQASVAAAITAAITAALGSVAGTVQRQSQTVSLAQLQAAGAVLVASFNVGSALPANARLLGAEIEVTQAFAGVGLVSALATIQGGSDAAGSIVTGAAMTGTGFKGGVGTNPYSTRGGQQVTITTTLVGINLSALTAGAFNVNLFYGVVA